MTQIDLSNADFERMEAHFASWLPLRQQQAMAYGMYALLAECFSSEAARKQMQAFGVHVSEEPTLRIAK